MNTAQIHSKTMSREEVVNNPEGDERRYWSTKVPIKDDNGTVTSFIGVSKDITELLELKSKLEHLAQTDELTQVFNRRHFFDLAAAEFDRFQRYKTPFAIVSLDLDHFKEVNDTYGHHIGDEVLKAVAEKCQETIRKTDFLGRIGGEEFAIGMPNIDRDGALVIAERLREEIAGLEIRGEFDGLYAVSCGT